MWSDLEGTHGIEQIQNSLKNKSTSQQLWNEGTLFLKKRKTKMTALARSIDLNVVGPIVFERPIEINGLGGKSCFITAPYWTVCVLTFIPDIH